MRLALTDAPAAFDHVYVDLVSIAIHTAAGASDVADGGVPTTTASSLPATAGSPSPCRISASTS